jgi:hypothetical protein
MCKVITLLRMKGTTEKEKNQEPILSMCRLMMILGTKQTTREVKI